MSPKRRSHLLTLLLPGLFLGIAYIYLLMPRVDREAAQAAEEVVKTRERIPTPTQESQQAAQEQRLQAEVKKLEALLATEGVAPAAAGSGERLSLLLARHRLLLLEETLDPAEAGATLPPGIDKAAGGRLRRLKLAGRYLDVLGALRGMLDPAIGAIPLRLVLGREGTDVRWTLLLWM